MQIEDIAMLKEMVMTCRPLIEEFIETLVEYGPALDVLLRRIAFAHCDIRIATIHRYMDAGFEKNEAILLMIDESYAIREALKNAVKKAKE